VPTTDGVLWFKEDPPADEFEPALTALLSSRRPDALPDLIAWEGRRMLTRHVGPWLRGLLDAGQAAPSWEQILCFYAELQIDFMEVAEEALALDTPDDRPELLPDRYSALGGDRLDPIRAAADRLTGTLPATVAHMEAHDGNIFVRDGRPIFIDWAEAVVTHPFVGPLQALRRATERGELEPGSAEVERLRDLYLEPFTGFAPMDDLRELFADGYLLHGVSRAELWRRTLDQLPQEARSEYGEPVAAWLAIIRELVDGTTTLGGA
jgi:Phosphotransferase enzyme family